MSTFVRGLKVTTVFGEGIVVNLPVSNRIAVQYESGEIRYFFPEDVITGRIRPAEELFIHSGCNMILMKNGGKTKKPSGSEYH